MADFRLFSSSGRKAKGKAVTTGRQDGGKGHGEGAGAVTGTPVPPPARSALPPPPSVPRPRSWPGLGLSPWLCASCTSMGMYTPTEVQMAVVPQVLAGKDVVACSQTGSGKVGALPLPWPLPPVVHCILYVSWSHRAAAPRFPTQTAAFALPILEKLAEDPYGVFAVVLTAGRELAQQIADQFIALGSGMTLRVAVVTGGADIVEQSKEVGLSFAEPALCVCVLAWQYGQLRRQREQWCVPVAAQNELCACGVLCDVCVCCSWLGCRTSSLRLLDASALSCSPALTSGSPAYRFVCVSVCVMCYV